MESGGASTVTALLVLLCRDVDGGGCVHAWTPSRHHTPTPALHALIITPSSRQGYMQLVLTGQHPASSGTNRSRWRAQYLLYDRCTVEIVHRSCYGANARQYTL